MTRAEYERTRVLPERKRATRNGKRSIDAFVKSIRDRIAVEYPESIDGFDNDIAQRLAHLYFYLTKYVTGRWDVNGMRVAVLCSDGDNLWYSDNLLDDSKPAEIERVLFKALLQEAIKTIDNAPSPCYDSAGV